ncbi:hypothetical protein F5148DRAFT_89383 [Russula earlei]|uniref:Uncharacterized protein n=1 Tax=Russula earlei TaxID=71964 RepID=A0ACC0U9T8_9AGAM|nr:hypothetical protein F5148DRAFT_89383 [Russula earlei]
MLTRGRQIYRFSTELRATLTIRVISFGSLLVSLRTPSTPCPSPTTPSAPRRPHYSTEPLPHETRLSQGQPGPFSFTATIAGRAPPSPGAEFIKDSKRGSLRLRLSRQEHNAAVPVFGLRGPIEGTLELLKPQELAFVAVHALPPSYEAHLSGLPGFTANVDYSVTAVASKTKFAKLGIGTTTVSTPFIYNPRSRPARMIPPRLEPRKASPGLRLSPDWRIHEAIIATRMPESPSKNIVCKFYTPASHVLCMRGTIPYHITFMGSAMALATLLTYLPSRTGAPPIRACSRIQILRQTSVDVKNEYPLATGATSEMWRTRSIGEGSLYRTHHYHQGDGPDWLSFAGEIDVDQAVTIGGFRAAGLWVKDCIVFTITPPHPLKGPIGDMRCVIPIRLVTDPAWSLGAMPYDVFIPQASPTPSEARDSVTDLSCDVSSAGEYFYERTSYSATESAE